MKFHPDSLPKNNQKHRKRIKTDALNGFLLYENFTPHFRDIVTLLSDRGLPVEKLINAAKKSVERSSFRKTSKKRNIFSEEMKFQAQWYLDEPDHESCDHDHDFGDLRNRFCHMHIDRRHRLEELSDSFFEDEDRSSVEFKTPSCRSFEGAFGNALPRKSPLPDMDCRMNWLSGMNRSHRSMDDLDIPTLKFKEDLLNSWLRSTQTDLRGRVYSKTLQRASVPKVVSDVSHVGDSTRSYRTDAKELKITEINDTTDAGDACATKDSHSDDNSQIQTHQKSVVKEASKISSTRDSKENRYKELQTIHASISSKLSNCDSNRNEDRDKAAKVNEIVMKMRIHHQKLCETGEKQDSSLNVQPTSYRVFRNSVATILEDVCERVINHLLAENKLWATEDDGDRKDFPQRTNALIKIESLSELGNGVITYKDKTHGISLPSLPLNNAAELNLENSTLLKEILTSSENASTEEKNDPWKILAMGIKSGPACDDPDQAKHDDEAQDDEAGLLANETEPAECTKSLAHDISEFLEKTRDSSSIRSRGMSEKSSEENKSRDNQQNITDPGSSDPSDCGKSDSHKRRSDSKSPRSKLSCTLRNVSKNTDSTSPKNFVGKSKTVCRKTWMKFTKKNVSTVGNKEEKITGSKKFSPDKSNLQLGRRPVFPPVQVRLQKRSQPLIIPPEFTRRFQELAKYTDPLKTGVVITKALSASWLKEAQILDERVTEDTVNHIFALAAGQRLVLNIHDYLRYLTKISLLKNMRVNELVEVMMRSKPVLKKSKNSKKKKKFQPKSAGVHRDNSPDRCSLRGSSLPDDMKF